MFSNVSSDDALGPSKGGWPTTNSYLQHHAVEHKLRHSLRCRAQGETRHATHAQENADGPVVHSPVVRGAFHHLRRQVRQSAAQRGTCAVVALDNGPTKVGNLDGFLAGATLSDERTCPGTKARCQHQAGAAQTHGAAAVTHRLVDAEKDVLGLDVTMDDALGVCVRQRAAELLDVHRCSILGEALVRHALHHLVPDRSTKHGCPVGHTKVTYGEQRREPVLWRTIDIGHVQVATIAVLQQDVHCVVAKRRRCGESGARRDE